MSYLSPHLAPQNVETPVGSPRRAEAVDVAVTDQVPECCICLDPIVPTGQTLLKCGTCQKFLHVSCAMSLKDTRCPNCRSVIFQEIPCDDARFQLRLDLEVQEAWGNAMDTADRIRDEAAIQIQQAQDLMNAAREANRRGKKLMEAGKREKEVGLQWVHFGKKRAADGRRSEANAKELMEEVKVLDWGLGCCFVFSLVLIPFICIGVADFVAYITAGTPHSWTFVYSSLAFWSIIFWVLLVILLIICGCCIKPPNVKPLKVAPGSTVPVGDIEEGENLIAQPKKKLKTSTSTQTLLKTSTGNPYSTTISDDQKQAIFVCMYVLGAVVLVTFGWMWFQVKSFPL